MEFPYWTIPSGITLWMLIWIYLGQRSGGSIVMQMRAVGGVLLSASVWLIWWLVAGVRYTHS